MGSSGVWVQLYAVVVFDLFNAAILHLDGYCGGVGGATLGATYYCISGVTFTMAAFSPMFHSYVIAPVAVSLVLWP